MYSFSQQLYLSVSRKYASYVYHYIALYDSYFFFKNILHFQWNIELGYAFLNIYISFIENMYMSTLACVRPSRHLLSTSSSNTTSHLRCKVTICCHLFCVYFTCQVTIVPPTKYLYISKRHFWGHFQHTICLFGTEIDHWMTVSLANIFHYGTSWHIAKWSSEMDMIESPSRFCCRLQCF